MPALLSPGTGGVIDFSGVLEKRSSSQRAGTELDFHVVVKGTGWGMSGTPRGDAAAFPSPGDSQVPPPTEGRAGTGAQVCPDRCDPLGEPAQGQEHLSCWKCLKSRSLPAKKSEKQLSFKPHKSVQ